mmetsp:Transcript_48569/g.152615  ORF Transcript_48569/g.152615 Transcript_48569/m.152615 type:complete len:317 (-) Transcript_48569:84-1034(-)
MEGQLVVGHVSRLARRTHLVPGRLYVVRQGRRQLLHAVAQPAHPPILWLVLGARLALGARRPHQDCAQGAGHRHPALGPAHAQLRQRRLVPRRLARRPIPVDPLAAGRHLVRNLAAVHGLLGRVQGRYLCARRLELHADERGPHVRHLRPRLRRPLPLPERHHRRVRPHLWRARDAEGDLCARSDRVHHRRGADREVHGRHRHAALLHDGPRHLRRRLGHLPQGGPLLDRPEQLGRVLGRAGLRQGQVGSPRPRASLRVGDRPGLHRPRAAQPVRLLRGRLQLRRVQARRRHAARQGGRHARQATRRARRRPVEGL